MSTNRSKSGENDLQNLERIFELMEKHEVVELEWERSGERLKLRTRQSGSDQALNAFNPALLSAALANYKIPSESPSVAHKVSDSPSAAMDKSPAGASKSAILNSNQKQIASPFVGTFYRSSTPTTDPYIREGQTVKRGDILCIIEAMKLMNEIEADIPGKIISVLVENGQPVEFGEPLFIIEP